MVTVNEETEEEKSTEEEEEASLERDSSAHAVTAGKGASSKMNFFSFIVFFYLAFDVTSSFAKYMPV